jgi:hypothetical protein
VRTSLTALPTTRTLYNPGNYSLSASFKEARKSIVFAMGAININARYLNIDGLVQSGVDTVELTISPDFAPTGSVNFTTSAGDIRQGISFGADNLVTVDGFFDADKGLIILEDIKPTGGVVNLTGTIVSTGNGQIKVASGYASVKINNQSRYELAVGTIDVSENRVGTITITDTPTLSREIFTVQNGWWTRVLQQGTLTLKTDGGNSISSIRYNTVETQTGIQADTRGQGYLPLYYNPVAGRYYSWTEGQAMTQTEVYTYEERSFNLIGFDWDFLAPDTEAKDVEQKFTDGTPLLESEVVITPANTSATLLVDYVRKSNPAVDLTKNVSLVRDVNSNKLYQYVGDTGGVSFPVINFTDTAKWKFVEDLTGGKRVLDQASVKANPTDSSKWLYVYDNTESNRVKRVDGTNWTPKKAENRLDSSFANQEITIKGPTKTGGGWLRETVITTIKTTVSGLKDFYTYSLKADNPIAITATVGASAPTVDIQTTGTLRLSSSITLGGNVADEAEDFVPIALSANALEVSGTAVFVGALPEIKANSDVIIKVKDAQGRLNIQATGAIRVEQLVSSTPAQQQALKIGQIVAASFIRDGQTLAAGSDVTGAEVSQAYDVQIISRYGILGTAAASRIMGSTLELDGGTGLIAARIDSGAGGAGTGGVAARAAGSISLTETLGDMRLVAPHAWTGTVSIETLSDVILETKAGAITDGWNERLVADPRATSSVIVGNLSSSQAAEAGFGSLQEMTDRARYALAPDLVAAIFPHQDTMGQGSAATEQLNIRALYFTLNASASAEYAAGVGSLSDQLTILRPGNTAGLSTQAKELLARASARDVVDVSYQRYRYIGTGDDAQATFDLAAVGLFGNPLLWEKVSGEPPADVPMLGSTDGIVSVRHGQWVEDRRDVRSVTIRLVDDLNISASGALAVRSQGDVAVRAESDIRVEVGLTNGLALRGIDAAGGLWLSTAGSITANNPTGFTPLQSGGDIELRADGTLAGSAGNIQTLAGDALVIDAGAQGQRVMGSTAYSPGVLTVAAKGHVSLQEQTGTMWLSSVTSALQTSDTWAVELSTRGGDIRASERAEDSLVLNLQAGRVRLLAGSVDVNGSRNIGDLLNPLRMDVDVLLAGSRSSYASVIAIEDSDDLTLMPRDGDAPALDFLNNAEGRLVVRAAGDLVVNSALRVQASDNSAITLVSTTGHLRLNNDITLGNGLLTLQAGLDVLQASGTRILNPLGRISVQAGSASDAGVVTGSMVQAQNSVLSSSGTGVGTAGGGAIDLVATGDIQVNQIDAGSGDLTLTAGRYALTGSIIESGADIDNDLRGGAVRLQAAGSIGTLGRRGQGLELSAQTLQLNSAGDVAVWADGSLNLLGLQAGVKQSAAQVTPTSASAVLVLTSGDLQVSGDVSLAVAGNLLLQAEAGAITLGAGQSQLIGTHGGNLSLLAASGLQISGLTSLTSLGGSIDVLAASGALAMASGSTVSSLLANGDSAPAGGNRPSAVEYPGWATCRELAGWGCCASRFGGHF